MGNFKEDYDKRLRRICGVTDDTLRVIEDSETVYYGYCETCRFTEEVITVKVYKNGQVISEREFDYMSDLIKELDEIELGGEKE